MLLFFFCFETQEKVHLLLMFPNYVLLDLGVPFVGELSL